MPCFRGGFSQRASPTPNTSQGGGGGFVTPDLFNNFGFEIANGGGGWGTGTFAFSNFTGPPNVPDDSVIDTSIHFAGSQSMGYTIVPSSGESGTHTLCKFPTQNNRVWTRFYFRATSAVDSIWKFHRFYDSNFNNASGGWFMQDGISNPIFGLGFDQENGAHVFDVGINRSEVIDSNWHSLEVDYWRNGDPTGFPSFACWLDGVQRSLPNGNAGNGGTWINGRINAGERNGTNNLGYIEWIGTLNASNTQNGRINIDNFSASSLGRIGP